MTMLKAIGYANLLPFIALIALLCMIERNHLFHKRQGAIFRTGVWVNLLLLVAISADAWLSDLPYQLYPSAWIFRNVTSCLNFATSPIIPLCLYVIFFEKKRGWLLYAPCILNTTICVISLFTNVVYRISPMNYYDRGPLFLLPFSTSVFYMGMLIFGKPTVGGENKASERFFLCATVFAMVGCMYLELAHQFRFLTWDCAAISLVLYYLLININNANADPLTGAANRAIYMKRLSEIDRTTRCVVAMLDINNFKHVNDTQGHAAGDRYLVAFVQAVQAALPKEGSLYRIGGDEFAVLSKKWTETEMLGHMEAARKNANRVGIDFAYGVAEYQADVPVEDALRLADNAMYRHKHRAKEEVNGTKHARETVDTAIIG